MVIYKVLNKFGQPRCVSDEKRKMKDVSATFIANVQVAMMEDRLICLTYLVSWIEKKYCFLLVEWFVQFNKSHTLWFKLKQERLHF